MGKIIERVMDRDTVFFKTFWPALVLVTLAALMVVIIYGMESVAPGVHDAFHDFRHVIGMPCH